MKKTITAYLFIIAILSLAACKTKTKQEDTPKPKQEETIDLGIKKTEVMKSEEMPEGTKVSVAKTDFDFTAIKAKNKDVDFVQEGNTVRMMRGNAISGSFDCSCVGGNGSNTKCSIIISGQQISCKNDGCNGKCEMLIIIKDTKVTRFW